MSPPLTLDQLYAALEASPASAERVLALAEHHARAGHFRAAAALHWSVLEQKRPFCYHRDSGLTVEFDDWGEGWYWWATTAADYEDANYGMDWGHPPACRLPLALWRELPHTFDYDPAVFKEYPTLRAAYQALIDGWTERLTRLTDPNQHPAKD